MKLTWVALAISVILGITLAFHEDPQNDRMERSEQLSLLETDGSERQQRIVGVLAAGARLALGAARVAAPRAAATAARTGARAAARGGARAAARGGARAGAKKGARAGARGAGKAGRRGGKRGSKKGKVKNKNDSNGENEAEGGNASGGEENKRVASDDSVSPEGGKDELVNQSADAQKFEVE